VGGRGRTLEPLYTALDLNVDMSTHHRSTLRRQSSCRPHSQLMYITSDHTDLYAPNTLAARVITSGSEQGKARWTDAVNRSALDMSFPSTSTILSAPETRHVSSRSGATTEGRGRTDCSHSRQLVLQIRRGEEGEHARVNRTVRLVEGFCREGPRAREDLRAGALISLPTLDSTDCHRPLTRL
jgi:hypothetical protein